MKSFTATNGMFNYEVIINKNGYNREFKLRSTSDNSSLFESDDDFQRNVFLDLGYYEAKGLSESGFSDDQINDMFKI